MAGFRILYDSQHQADATCSGRSDRLRLGFGDFEYFELIPRRFSYFAGIGNDARDALYNSYGFGLTVTFAACV